MQRVDALEQLELVLQLRILDRDPLDVFGHAEARIAAICASSSSPAGPGISVRTASAIRVSGTFDAGFGDPVIVELPSLMNRLSASGSTWGVPRMGYVWLLPRNG